jgi:hypothetical protein
MFYAIYDAEGRIIQGNKVFWNGEEELTKHELNLNDMEQKFVKKDALHVLSPDHYFVKRKRLKERPNLFVTVSANTIKAGGTESAVLRGIPKGARYFITTGGIEVAQGVMEDTEIEIFIPVPCIYRVTLDMWPYQTFRTDIEAVA